MTQSILKWVAYFGAIGCFIQSLHFYSEGLMWWPSIILGIGMMMLGMFQEGDI